MFTLIRRALGLMAVVALCATTSMAAELQLNRYYSDGMVLQRDKANVIRGSADAGATITVSFAGQTKTAKAAPDGTWDLTVDALPANRKGATLSVTASSGGSTKISDVVVGDVFIFARQTAIDVSLGKDEAGQKIAKKHKTNPNLRAISIKTIAAKSPQADLAAASTAGWSVVSSKQAAAMSAAAYYFGADLAGEVDVPVGVVDLNMGGHFPIGWMSRDALLETSKFYGRTDVDGLVPRMEELAEAIEKGETPKKNYITGNPVEYPLYPAAGYNAVLYPLRGTAVKGIVLQLGGNYPYLIYSRLEDKGLILDRKELNAAYVQTYDIRKVGHRMDSVTTPRIPREWRHAFADNDLPIGLVMPPSSALRTLARHAIEMRELQRKIAEDIPGVGLIVPGMNAVPFSAQPADEQLLAKRSAAWAMGAVYKKPDIEPTGPLFDHMQASFNTAKIYFKPGTAEGLKKTGKTLDGFEVAGVEGEYYPAKAEVVGDTIEIESDSVRRIDRVRYNWQEMPVEALVNADGLPAVAFRTEDAPYRWFHVHSEDDLPDEYFTPANQWKGGDVTLVNGQLKTFGYPNFAGWLGPVGVKVGPFGPNMGVREVLANSPAEGKLKVGDIIYSANGKMLGEKTWEVMAEAITYSETREAGGKLSLGVRRNGKLLDVNVMLEVMGTYSPTAPYDCPKTEKIVAQLEKWLADRDRGDGFLGSDALFLLGAGNPKYQGLVRRAIYKKMDGIKLHEPDDPSKGQKNWFLAWDAMLFGEYYLTTGDRNVLPYLQNRLAWLAARQNPEGGWRHNFPGGDHYGLLPAIGVAGMIGFHFGNDAGVDVDQEAYARGIRFYKVDAAEMGFIIYGYPKSSRPAPPVFDPADLANGQLQTSNGAIAAAAILFKLEGNTRTAHLCSLMSSYAWNTTYGGHGGNFWNNFWTPLGSHAHGREAFINFWKNHRWYRELNRMFDGSLIINEDRRVGAGHGLALVAPLRRLQITGAVPSPFAKDAPEFLKPAVAAYFHRDYAKSQKLVEEMLASGTIGKNERPIAEKLLYEAKLIQQSIKSDLARIDALAKEGRMYEAAMDVPQLRGVLPEGDARLAAAEQAVQGQARADDRELYEMAQSKLVDATAERVGRTGKPEEAWQPLVTEFGEGRKNRAKGQVPEDQASKWRLKVVEERTQAPDGWTEPRFDDSNWLVTALPISWHLNHTALLRTKFNVDNPKDYDGLRFRAWLFRQQAIEIYLNGTLIGKVNNLEKKTGNVEAVFNKSALKQLKKGENTLAIVTRQNWRWGMLSMRVYNDGFSFMLDASKK